MAFNGGLGYCNVDVCLRVSEFGSRFLGYFMFVLDTNNTILIPYKTGKRPLYVRSNLWKQKCAEVNVEVDAVALGRR